MKKYILGAVVAFSILASPAFTQAAGLTAGQIGAIIQLLQVFGADQSVIDSVQTALNGGTTSGTGSTGDFTLTTVSPLTSGTVGTPYNASLSATGGSGNYVWSALSLPGCVFPSGLTVGSNGTISGTPTTAGAYSNVCIKVNSGGDNRSKTFTLVISGSSARTTTTCVNKFCSGNNSQVTEVANTAGLNNNPVGAVCCDGDWWIDSRGSTYLSGCNGKTNGLEDGGWFKCGGTVVPPPNSTSATLTWNNSLSLPDGTVGVPYSASISASGGSCPYTWSTGTSDLNSLSGYSADCLFPPGLSLNGPYGSKSATISGTPAEAGTFNAICIHLASGWPSTTNKFSVVIKAATGNLAITTTWLEYGNTGGSYHTTLSATGGSGTYAWSATGLPSGYTLNSSTGLISGFPDKSGTYTPKITVTSGTQSDSRQFTLIIDSAAWGKNVTACANTFCSGTNSKLTEISNGVGRSSISEGWGPVCCDGAWWVDTRGSNWYSACSGLGNLQSGGWYTCSSVTSASGPNQTASALDALNSAGSSSNFPSIDGFSYAWIHDLQIGSSYSADVRELQTTLTKEGVYSGDITGEFYNQTFVAVKAFQQKYGINPTGYVGAITREKLNALY